MKLVMIMELEGLIATSENLIVESEMFPHHNIRRYTWASPHGKTHDQIDHVWMDKRRHSNIFYVQSFTEVDYDIELSGGS
jgi:hypothetical protein